MERRLDALVIGAGTAGLATALAVARLGLSVTAIDRRSCQPAFAIGESLAPSVRPLLSRLGLWDGFVGTKPLPSPGNRSAWSTADPVSESFLARPGGRGWHIDRIAFDRLLERAATDAGAEVMRPCRVDTLGTNADGTWSVGLGRVDRSATGQVDARWLVDASGRAAVLARRLGSRRRVIDTQIAWATWLALEPRSAGSVEAGTWVEADPDGWWYTARIPGDRLVVARMTDPIAAGRHPPPPIQCAPPHTRLRLDRVQQTPLTPWRRWAAGTQRVTPSAGPGWVAVGDAAAAYDPISSHGIASALADALGIADSLSDNHHDRNTWEAFDRRTTHRFGLYLHDRAGVYRRVERYRDRPFWQARSAAPSGFMESSPL